MDESYDRIAPFYELEIGEYDEDVPFFRALARRTGGPILDAGCGTGRLALALAGGGHEVVAIDSSMGMLELARRKIPEELGHKIQLVHGDVRSLRGAGQFALAVMASGTFSHLATRADQEQALRCLHEYLQPGGTLALVLQNPYHWALDTAQDELVIGWEKAGPAAGETTRMSYAVHSELVSQTRTLRLWYDVAAADGMVRRHGATFRLRWSFQPELDLLLEKTGFSIEQWYGSYELEPYRDESPLLIAVAARRR